MLRFDEEVYAAIASESADDGLNDKLNDIHLDDENEEEVENEVGEWREAVERVLTKYEKAQTAKDQSESDFEEAYEQKLKEKMRVWKKEYYQVG